ncbi:hypothetical protein ACUXLG_005833 [Ralstonia sp. 121560039-2]|jgi:hypothetical protein
MSAVAQARRAAQGTDHEIEYETAIDDAASLADEIEKLSGKRPLVPNYRPAR